MLKKFLLVCYCSIVEGQMFNGNGNEGVIADCKDCEKSKKVCKSLSLTLYSTLETRH